MYVRIFTVRYPRYLLGGLVAGMFVRLCEAAEELLQLCHAGRTKSDVSQQRFYTNVECQELIGAA